MTLRIAVDIDSTLYDFQALAREVIKRMSILTWYDGQGSVIKLLDSTYKANWPEWRTPGDLLGEELWSQVLDLTHSPETILAQRPYEGAVEVLNSWDAEKFFITSREPDETAEATEQWLIDIGIENPTLLCTGRAGSKIPTLIMKETNVLIDDRPQTLVDFSYEANIDFVAAIGIRHDYNQGLTDVPRIDIVDRWDQIPGILEARVDEAYFRV